MLIVFYSTLSGNTRRFVERLGIPFLSITEADLQDLDRPFVLITPTYGGSVPTPVVQFLNNPVRRKNMLGVVNSGNINFGPDFGAAGRKIAAKCQVPLLHVFELTGLPEDVKIVYDKVEEIWNTQTHKYMATK